MLNFSKLLKKRLAESGSYKIYLTRSIDTFIPLAGRVKIARKKEAQLFISVHADSLPKRKAKGVRGATVYTLSDKASDAEAKQLALKENRSDILAGVELPEKSNPVTSILIDLAQRETKNHSIAFAKTLLTYLKDTGRLNKKPHRSANFRVLTAPDIPSVLLELGYLSSREDTKLMKSEKWRNKVANAIVKAVDTYFSKQVARIPY